MNIIASVITIPYCPFDLHIALRASEELRSRREGVVLDVSSTCVSSVTMLDGVGVRSGSDLGYNEQRGRKQFAGAEIIYQRCVPLVHTLVGSCDC